jgi:predicted PurR-regulated permease PerM
LLTIGLTIVVGSFDGDVLQPLVMGKAVNIHPLAIVVLIAAGSLTLGIIGAFIAVPVGSAVYGVFKFLSGRDPEHPRSWAWGAPGVDPDQAEFAPPAEVKKRRFWHRKKKQTA